MLSVSLTEERWRQFGKRLSKRSHRRVKANTWLVADVPDFLLNWVTPDSRHVGLDIDDHGHLLPQARTLKAKMGFLAPHSLVVSPRFYRLFVRNTGLEKSSRI